MFIRHVWVSIGVCTAAWAAPPGIGSWLVDLGRDYPLSAQAGLSDADATLTLLFMEAAVRVEPDLPAAYYWQYDMLRALDRPAEARQALAAYVRRQSGDAAAQLNWIESAISALQTAEERAEFCTAYLRREHLPAAATSDLHRRLAEHHWNRAEPERAALQAQAAVKADPFNLRARQLLAEVRQTATRPAALVEQYLWVLRANPASVQASAELGNLLAAAGEFGQAERFFAHATKLAEKIPPGHAPAQLLLQRADALASSGRLAEARKCIDQIIEHDPDDVPALLARAQLAGQQGDQAAAQAAVQQVSAKWRQRISAGQGGLDPRTLAELSWVLVHTVGDVEQGSALARSLLADPSTEGVAHRALGAALLRRQQWAEAREVLESSAGRDTWSAVLLAEALHKLGQTDAATRQVAALATRPAGVEQHRRIREIAQSLQTPAPTTRPDAEVAKVLEAFPGEVLDFAFAPEKYLSAAWTGPGQPTGCDPWPCTLTLRNTGPFPIVIGPEAMLSPEVLCSIQTSGDRGRSSGPSLRVQPRAGLQLLPGESVQMMQNFLVGPIRAAMIGTPQVTQQVELTAITNPLRLVDREGREVWAPAPGGLLIAPLKFQRAGIVGIPDQVNRLIAASAAPEADQRIEAASKLAMLLAEHQHLAAGRLSYAVPRIDAARVQSAVLARASDGDWRVRVQFTEMTRWFVLDKPATQVVTGMLGDPHWLVRGLAIRSLVDHHGEKSRPVLEWASKSDPDEWVRRFSGALLQRLRDQTTAAATRPTPAAMVRPTGPPEAAPAAPPTPPEQPVLLALPDEPPSTAPALPR